MLFRSAVKDAYACQPLSTAAVDKMKVTATIDLSVIDDSKKTRVMYEREKGADMIVLDRSGKLIQMNEASAGEGHNRKIYPVTGFMAASVADYLLGMVMVDNLVAILSSQDKVSRLYNEGKEIYSTENYPSEVYFNSWSSVGRVVLLCRKRAFFASTNGDIVSLLMDKAAIDRGASIETKHHSMQELAHIWVEHSDIVCLSVKGQLEIVRYTSTSKSPRCIELKDHLFHKSSPFATKITEAVAITGCSQYLAVASFSNIDKTSTICLLDRKGRFMSRTTDEGKPVFLGGPNTIHRMEFTVFEKHVYLVALNLFTFVSLYLINPRSRADIIYIRSVRIHENNINWTLVSLPSQPGGLITANQSGKSKMLQISLNYS